MQLLTQHTIRNLTNILRTHGVKQVLPSVENKASALVQHYATAPTEQKLLRFPAFPLEETLSKFLRSTQPLLSKEEYEITKKATDEFQKGEGAKLQKLLEQTASKEENWLAKRWLNAAYMQYRDPVTVYSSPGMTFPLTEFKCDEDYLLYASNVVYGLIKYKELIDKGEIPVIKMGKYELDNSQFNLVYGTCRIPQPKEDCLQYNPKSDYIIVIYKNHFYKFKVYNKKGLPLHPKVITAELKKIVEKEKKDGVPFGLLTTDHRDNWVKAYKALLEPKENAPCVGIIQKCLFTLSLDDKAPSEKAGRLTVNGEQLIHGGGKDCNGGNRWMDKTIQVVVNRNGMSGFTYEHSPAEGQPIALMTDFIVKNLNNDQFCQNSAMDDYETPQKIHLNKTDSIDKHIATAGGNLDKLANNLQLYVLHFETYGKNFFKKQKLSPDSCIQMALQYAFYKVHKEAAAQYESAHLRIYAGGRTETIRSCSNESLAFAKAMSDSKVDPKSKVECLRTAVESHREYTNIALQGRGVDRHLLGLKLMAIENNLPIPAFFKTPGFVKSANFRISTSQVASANVSFMCYGPSVENGYGCCYNPRNNDVLFAISAWNSNNETDAERFAAALTDALEEIFKLLTTHGEQPKAKL